MERIDTMIIPDHNLILPDGRKVPLTTAKANKLIQVWNQGLIHKVFPAPQPQPLGWHENLDAALQALDTALQGSDPALGAYQVRSGERAHGVAWHPSEREYRRWAGNQEQVVETIPYTEPEPYLPGSYIPGDLMSTIKDCPTCQGRGDVQVKGIGPCPELAPCDCRVRYDVAQAAERCLPGLSEASLTSLQSPLVSLWKQKQSAVLRGPEAWLRAHLWGLYRSRPEISHRAVKVIPDSELMAAYRATYANRREDHEDGEFSGLGHNFANTYIQPHLLTHS